MQTQGCSPTMPRQTPTIRRSIPRPSPLHLGVPRLGRLQQGLFGLAVLGLGLPAMAWPIAARAAANIGLAGHHANYRLVLQSTVNQGVLAAEGSLDYDLSDACNGWTTAQHLVINLTDRDGHDTRMVSDYATFETKDGTRLSFHTRQVNGQATTESLDGTAQLDHPGGRGHADFTGAARHRVELPPGTVLPNAHTLAIIQAGAAGKHFLAMPLFDGTGADGAQDSFTTIEPWQAQHTTKWQPLSHLPSGRVHVAFYDRDQTSELPDYETGMRYFNNGVADEMEMNFGDFVLRGRIETLQMKPAPRC